MFQLCECKKERNVNVQKYSFLVIQFFECLKFLCFISFCFFVSLHVKRILLKKNRKRD